MSHFTAAFADELIKVSENGFPLARDFKAPQAKPSRGSQPTMNFKTSEGMQIPSQSERAVGAINSSLKKTQSMMKGMPSPQKPDAVSGAGAKPTAPRQYPTYENYSREDSAMLRKRDDMMAARNGQKVVSQADMRKKPDPLLAKRDALFAMRAKNRDSSDALLAKRDRAMTTHRNAHAGKSSTVAKK